MSDFGFPALGLLINSDRSSVATKCGKSTEVNIEPNVCSTYTTLARATGDHYEWFSITALCELPTKLEDTLLPSYNLLYINVLVFGLIRPV